MVGIGQLQQLHGSYYIEGALKEGQNAYGQDYGEDTVHKGQPTFIEKALHTLFLNHACENHHQHIDSAQHHTCQRDFTPLGSVNSQVGCNGAPNQRHEYELGITPQHKSKAEGQQHIDCNGRLYT